MNASFPNESRTTLSGKGEENPVFSPYRKLELTAYRLVLEGGALPDDSENGLKNHQEKWPGNEGRSRDRAKCGRQPKAHGMAKRRDLCRGLAGGEAPTGRGEVNIQDAVWSTGAASGSPVIPGCPEGLTDLWLSHGQNGFLQGFAALWRWNHAILEAERY